MKATDKLLVGFTMVDWTDHEFAAWLREKDPNWKINKLTEEWTQFITRGQVVAIVKYKNDYPVNRSIFIKAGTI